MLVKNVNASISLSLSCLQLVGFWPPKSLKRSQRTLYYCYGFIWLMFLLGSYIISQSVELYLVWGDLPQMTAVSFVLFTNVAHIIKIFYITCYRDMIRGIINECDVSLRAADSEEARAVVKGCIRETVMQQATYCVVTFFTLFGWAFSAEKGKLPLKAWYPYDVTDSPAYELSYVYQIGALNVDAYLNVAKDTMITSLIAQCRCRLQLLRISLKTLCRDMQTSELLFTSKEELVINERLRLCVEQHHSALQAAVDLQYCFSVPTFTQFNVSLVIICVTAFQLVSVTSNPLLFMAMGTYLFNMMLQVFLYCYHGNQLTEESIKIADAAYECPWYLMSTPLRRSLLIIMTRSRRAAKITAGGFTTLSLACFTGIIKTSYSLFTLLRQLDLDD